MLKPDVSEFEDIQVDFVSSIEDTQWISTCFNLPQVSRIRAEDMIMLELDSSILLLKPLSGVHAIYKS